MMIYFFSFFVLLVLLKSNKLFVDLEAAIISAS